MTTDVVDVLWTSGWDSTFRVADLVLSERRTVQPWYILDSARRSSKRELATMARIRDALAGKDPATRQRLLPTKVHRVEDIPPNPLVTARWLALTKRSHLGSQYDWLARFTDAQNVTLELSIHRDDKAHGFLADLVELTPDGSYQLKAGHGDADLTIFSRFTFPLFEYTKLRMQELAIAAGFDDVMEMTWFCYQPLLRGRPCGYCNPCRYTREEGMGRRVSEQTPARRAQFLIISKAWGIWLKMRAALRRVRPGR